MESAPQPIEPQSPGQCELLRQRLIEARRENVQLLTKFDVYRQAVRTMIITHIQSGELDLEDTNRVLESWGERRFKPNAGPYWPGEEDPWDETAEEMRARLLKSSCPQEQGSQGHSSIDEG